MRFTSKLPVLLVTLVLTVSCTLSAPQPSQKLLRDYMRTPDTAAFSRTVMDEGFFKGTVSEEDGAVSIATDPLETPLVKEGLTDYCEFRGGSFEKRYVPSGLSETLTEGYKNQAVFFYDAKIGRTEFQFCTVENGPLFAYTHNTATELLLLEGAALDTYIQRQNALVETAAQEALNVTGFYATSSPSTAQGHTLTQAKLILYSSAPEIHATLKNTKGGPVQAELAIPAGIMADTERHLLTPAYRGGEMLNISVTGDGCSLDKMRTVLTLQPTAVCEVSVVYTQDTEIKKITAPRVTLFLAGHAVTMERGTELDTGDSSIWLKPRLHRIK